MPAPVHVAVVLPRLMRFSPQGATAIDLVAHDLLVASRHRAATVVVAEAVDRPFADAALVPFTRRPGEPHALLARRLAHLVAAGRPDVVVVHQHVPIAAGIARRLAPTPVLLHTHGWPKPPRHALDRWRRGRLYRRFAGLVFVSQACRTAFAQGWGELVPLHTVPNALDLSGWQPAAVREPLIVLAARLHPEKCVLESAQALARVLPQRDGWRAILFGAMSDRLPAYADAVAAALAPLGARAELRRDRPQAEVKVALERAAVALFPTRARESFGRAALEAFAGGAALAATPAGGLAEVIADAALPIATPDAAGIAAAIERLTGDAALRAELAARGRERAALYDIGPAAAAYDDLLAATARGERFAAPARPV